MRRMTVKVNIAALRAAGFDPRVTQNGEPGSVKVVAEDPGFATPAGRPQVILMDIRVPSDWKAREWGWNVGQDSTEDELVIEFECL